jgi:hypothetical protein
MHLSSQFYAVPFDVLWRYLSDPLRFPLIFPGWVSSVEWHSGSTYIGTDSTGESFQIIPRLDREHGVADFDIIDAEGHIERSRMRVFALQGGGCLLVHLAERWQGVDDSLWEAHRQAIDADLIYARTIIEQAYGTLSPARSSNGNGPHTN